MTVSIELTVHLEVVYFVMSGHVGSPLDNVLLQPLLPNRSHISLSTVSKSTDVLYLHYCRPYCGNLSKWFLDNFDDFTQSKSALLDLEQLGNAFMRLSKVSMASMGSFLDASVTSAFFCSMAVFSLRFSNVSMGSINALEVNNMASLCSTSNIALEKWRPDASG